MSLNSEPHQEAEEPQPKENDQLLSDSTSSSSSSVDAPIERNLPENSSPKPIKTYLDLSGIVSRPETPVELAMPPEVEEPESIPVDKTVPLSPVRHDRLSNNSSEEASCDEEAPVNEIQENPNPSSSNPELKNDFVTTTSINTDSIETVETPVETNDDPDSETRVENPPKTSEDSQPDQTEETKNNTTDIKTSEDASHHETTMNATNPEEKTENSPESSSNEENQPDNIIDEEAEPTVNEVNNESTDTVKEVETEPAKENPVEITADSVVEATPAPSEPKTVEKSTETNSTNTLQIPNNEQTKTAKSSGLSVSGSRIMNANEEGELEKLRAERAAHGGRRGAFYAAPPPPAFRAKLGSNHNEFVPNPPTGSSGLILPILKSPNSHALTIEPLKRSRRVSCGFAETTGRRPSMEDSWMFYSQGKEASALDIFGVFDGHRGDSAAKFASEFMPSAIVQLMKVAKKPQDWLRLAFIQTNLAMKQAGIATGTTAVVGMYWKSTCYIANAGDSRCVHGRVRLGGAPIAARITEDHKPERLDETERIVALGGEVKTNVNKEGKIVGRVNGQLGVSRALGDFDLEPYIIPDPELYEIEMSRNEAGAAHPDIPDEALEPVASSSATPSTSTIANTNALSAQADQSNLAPSSASSDTNSTNTSPASHVSPLGGSKSAPPDLPLSASVPTRTASSSSLPKKDSASKLVQSNSASSVINSSPQTIQKRPHSSTAKKRPDSGNNPPNTSVRLFVENVHGIDSHGNMDFLILACDGLWDVVSDEEAVNICHHILMNSLKNTGDTNDSHSASSSSSSQASPANTKSEDHICQQVEECAKRLRNIAFARGSTDNITVLVVSLQSPTAIKKSTSCTLL